MFPRSHTINTLLNKLARSGWLDTFPESMDLDFILVKKHTKKNLANIQPSQPHSWSIIHISWPSLWLPRREGQNVLWNLLIQNLCTVSLLKNNQNVLYDKNNILHELFTLNTCQLTADLHVVVLWLQLPEFLLFFSLLLVFKFCSSSGV